MVATSWSIFSKIHVPNCKPTFQKFLITHNVLEFCQRLYCTSTLRGVCIIKIYDSFATKHRHRFSFEPNGIDNGLWHHVYIYIYIDLKSCHIMSCFRSIRSRFRNAHVIKHGLMRPFFARFELADICRSPKNGKVPKTICARNGGNFLRRGPKKNGNLLVILVTVVPNSRLV